MSSAQEIRARRRPRGALPGRRVPALLVALQCATLAWSHSDENAGVPALRVLQGLNRVVFDLYLRSHMWVKGSIQMRSESLHNYSVIYGWECRHRAWFYVAFNDVEDTAEDSGRSLFAKVAYTF